MRPTIDIKIFFLWFFANCFLAFNGFGQTVQTFIDNNKILIGEQIQYKIKAAFPENTYKINWAGLPDTIPHFEIVKQSAVDTAKADNQIVFEQTITYTSFDSGKWILPALTIQAKNLNTDSTIIVNTDSFAIDVLYAPADSTNQLRDIKPVIEVTVRDYFWYYVAGGILILILLGWITWRYVKKRKKHVQKPAVILSAYDEAIQALEALQLNAGDNAALKSYHSRLAEILKRYYGRITGKNIFNNTTGDILVQLSIGKISNDEVSKIAVALRCGDAVKFAKFKPSDTESENCKFIIKDAIKKIDQYLVKNNSL